MTEANNCNQGRHQLKVIGKCSCTLLTSSVHLLGFKNIGEEFKADESFPVELEPRRFSATDLECALSTNLLDRSLQVLEAREIGEESVVGEGIRELHMSNFQVMQNMRGRACTLLKALAGMPLLEMDLTPFSSREISLLRHFPTLGVVVKIWTLQLPKETESNSKDQIESL